MSTYRYDIEHKLGSLQFIKNIVYYPSVESTNTATEKLAHNGCEEWTVVVADSQNNGRGRQGRLWHSPPGVNIYTSFLLKPALSYEHFPAISLLAGMVVAIVVERFTGCDAELKWPNDVLVGGKKISGILLELGHDSRNKPSIVVGIGININSDIEHYLEELSISATSMKVLTDTTFDRAGILAFLYRVFHEWYTVYCDRGGFNGIREKYMQMFKMIGRHVQIDNGAEIITGFVKDIDAYGGLVLKSTHNETIHIKSGDVHIIPERE
ncbi:MAG: biotin--[acetyl-CoA-carboxylase] ligase [Deltaproteobacteria bacterium]|nr:biotin--[acetyl-CoA-carboxylase] ligase [Deltaproteobacteria bacterium]